ncbi:MAG: carotenoid biosynthesis protein [Chloroflexota bacterium]
MFKAYFYIFEAVVFLLFILTLRHAWKVGWPRVWALSAGIIFGLLLEWATIQQLHAYQYGRFALMIGEVPLMVGVAWGVIIYSVRLFSYATTLPLWAKPILDGLLALNIDLAMDTIAIRWGMWDWGISLEKEFFGVPYANFWAWFWVVFFFSSGLNYLGKTNLPFKKWLVPFGALIIGLLGVLGTNALIVFGVPRAWYHTTIGSVLIGALILIIALRPRLHHALIDLLAILVPAAFHLYFLIAGLISGVIMNPPALLGVSLLMIGAAYFLHRPGSFFHIKQT